METLSNRIILFDSTHEKHEKFPAWSSTINSTLPQEGYADVLLVVKSALHCSESIFPYVASPDSDSQDLCLIRIQLTVVIVAKHFLDIQWMTFIATRRLNNKD